MVNEEQWECILDALELGATDQEAPLAAGWSSEEYEKTLQDPKRARQARLARWKALKPALQTLSEAAKDNATAAYRVVKRLEVKKSNEASKDKPHPQKTTTGDMQNQPKKEDSTFKEEMLRKIRESEARNPT